MSSKQRSPRHDAHLSDDGLSGRNSMVMQPENLARIRQRSSTQSPKRHSVFGSRPRSNTSASTSSRESPASSMTSNDVHSLRSPTDGRTQSVYGLPPLEKQEKPAKSFLARSSRILRRQGSKFSISTTLDEEDEVEGHRHKRELSEIFHRSHRTRHSEAHEHFKMSISEPFDFQHVTHTNPTQFPPMDRASRNDLVTEFSCIRASQRPIGELKGIRAESIHFRNFSCEDLSAAEPVTSEAKVPFLPCTPPDSPEAVRPLTSPGLGQVVQTSRSFENFSRPGARVRSPTILPPPRSSSRSASHDIPGPTSQAIDALLGLHDEPTFPEFVQTTAEDRTGNRTSLSQLDLADVFHGHVGHAVTTDDNTAPLSQSPPPPSSHTLDLADVPEEEEATFWHGNESRSPPPVASPSGRFGSPVSPTYAFHRPLPSRNLSREMSHAPEAQESETELGTPGSPTLAGPEFEHDGTPEAADSDLRRQFSMKASLEDSWEDDIDYCYEHAAESNSNFDWVGGSLHDNTTATSHATLSSASSSALISPMVEPLDSMDRLSVLRSSDSGLATPDLMPGSAISMSTQEVLTPYSDERSPNAFSPRRGLQHGDYFKTKPASASLLSSTYGSDLNQDGLYEEFITRDGESEHHFTFYPQPKDYSVDHSPRSSYSPISKCNSQESMILSRAASVVRKHRSSVSTASVPELIYSVNSSREVVNSDAGSIAEAQSADSTNLPVPGPSRQNSAKMRRQSKSLAREVGHQSVMKNSSGCAPAEEAPPAMPTCAHDRAKSASTLETPKSMNMEGPPFATRMRSSTLSRQSKQGGYSLFPIPSPK